MRHYGGDNCKEEDGQVPAWALLSGAGLVTASRSRGG